MENKFECDLGFDRMLDEDGEVNMAWAFGADNGVWKCDCGEIHSRDMYEECPRCGLREGEISQ